MKRILFLLGLSLSILGFSQDSKIRLVLYAAPTATSMHGGSTIMDIDSKLGFAIGAGINYSFAKNFSVLTSIGYEAKGGKTDMEFTNSFGEPIGTGEMKWSYNYFSIPLLLQYSTATKHSFFVNAGTFFNFLLNAKVDAADYSNDLSEDAAKFETGIALETGVDFTLSEKLSLAVGLRNHLGLSGLNEDSNIKTNSLGLLIGLGINF